MCSFLFLFPSNSFSVLIRPLTGGEGRGGGVEGGGQERGRVVGGGEERGGAVRGDVREWLGRGGEGGEREGRGSEGRMWVVEGGGEREEAAGSGWRTGTRSWSKGSSLGVTVDAAAAGVASSDEAVAVASSS